MLYTHTHTEIILKVSFPLKQPLKLTENAHKRPLSLTGSNAFIKVMAFLKESRAERME